MRCNVSSGRIIDPPPLTLAFQSFSVPFPRGITVSLLASSCSYRPTRTSACVPSFTKIHQELNLELSDTRTDRQTCTQTAPKFLIAIKIVGDNKATLRPDP